MSVTMYAAAFLMQPPVGMFSDVSLWSIAQAVAWIVLAVALLILFRPLLNGIVRALQLSLRPRLDAEARRARRAMRDAELLQGMIMASTGPDDASELRAIAARG
jgi:hypothetical protein